MAILEQKIIRFFDTELRAAGEDSGSMRVEGYALKFNRETMIGSKEFGWREKIAKTALEGADLTDVVFDFNHSFDALLARTINRSLTLNADDIGLKIDAKIVDTANGREVYTLIKEGLITHMSWMAHVTGDEWQFAEEDSNDVDLRVITKLGRFFDVSAVTFPAYEDTEVSARGFGAGAADAETEAWLKSEHEKRARGWQMARLDVVMRKYRK